MDRVQAQERIDETERSNREKEESARKRAEQNKPQGSVIYADPVEAFEDYIKPDEVVNIELFSLPINETLGSTNTVATEKIIQPLVKKYGDLGFSFTLDNCGS